MLQQAKVVRIIDENKAEISVARASACGHDCESCSGCGMSSAPVNAEAINSLFIFSSMVLLTNDLRSNSSSCTKSFANSHQLSSLSMP